jgi:hypothetical protein
MWAASEYETLARYDGSTTEQAMNGATSVFGCHQADEFLCAGWVAVFDMGESLAVRLHWRSLDLDAILAYTTDVPLFGSGAEAAEHGKRDIGSPSPEAMDAVDKVARSREIRGVPVRFRHPDDDD